MVRVRLLTSILIGVLFGTVGTVLVAGQAQATEGYCGIAWGSSPKTAEPYSQDGLTDIRTGGHQCWDRMVLQMNGPAAGYDVHYVGNVYADGSGQLVPLSGGAKLQIVLKAPSYDQSGRPTYSQTAGGSLPGVNLAGYRTFRDARFAGSFEGQSTIGLGVRARLPFRVFKLDDRVVLDVAHFW